MEPNIHQKINLKMIQLLDFYLITNNPTLRKWIPSSLKGKARFNTCYDFPRPNVPLEVVNDYVSNKSEKAKAYIRNNIQYNKYLRVDILPGPQGITRNTFSLLKELPDNYSELERIGVSRFIKTKDLKL